MQKIKFTKMHGLGNDFIVINGLSQSVNLSSAFLKKLAHRQLGIGFDQLLLIEPSTNADFFCRIFNSDGSEAEQCGNGMRCVARFANEEKLISKKQMTIETKSGVVKIGINDFQQITVDMGKPSDFRSLELALPDRVVPLDIISTGNPHAILTVDSLIDFPVKQLGQLISTHSVFPHGTNVGFMEIINRQHIRLRTFERGSGETFACGSNSCAAVVAGINKKLLDKKVKVELALGDLWIEWPGEPHSVMMTGPAERVFEGVVE